VPTTKFSLSANRGGAGFLNSQTALVM